MTAATAVSWLQRAACRDRDSRLWFSGDAFEVAVAVSVCRTCEVRRECLDDALRTEVDDGSRYGVRGGLTASERRGYGLAASVVQKSDHRSIANSTTSP